MCAVSTCLSPAVHSLVCEFGFEIQSNYDIRSILTPKNEVCWKSIIKNVHYKDTGKCLDYAESVRHLGPVCDSIHSHLMSLPFAVFEEQFEWCFHWTNNSKLFLCALTDLKESNGTNISLSLMKMTSSLERSLGDVYLMVGKECPFLLRDLLGSAGLAEIFSKHVMDVLKIFLGAPESLNLRNILWHGFASPDEIPPK
ncbi:hypothetical protein GDO86_009511 [Hymenochirus boettgeri]|uniref:DUF4209 domain-containing protein n=1 Tax=Hymenochirus boettgeri TaxID=247094 RepID=A0A8T2JGP7_9PIPI|nr:hypothetical protein GDO86_009511 [Hymenochirus boettgeri]